MCTKKSIKILIRLENSLYEETTFQKTKQWEKMQDLINGNGTTDYPFGKK